MRQLAQKRWPEEAQTPICALYCWQLGQRVAQLAQMSGWTPSLLSTASARRWLRHWRSPQWAQATWQERHTLSPQIGQRSTCSAQARSPQAQQLEPQLSQLALPQTGQATTPHSAQTI